MIFQYQTDKIGLNPLTREDILKSNYAEWFYDPIVTKFNSHGIFPMTKEKIEEFLMSLGDGTRIVFAIYALRTALEWNFSKEEMKGIPRECFHIGNVSLQKIDLLNRSAEFAIIIGEPDFYKLGIATQTAKFMIYHAFVILGLNRLWAGTSIGNVGMFKVFEKLGFKKEGTSRKAFWKNGFFHHVCHYGLLYEDESVIKIIEEIDDDERRKIDQPNPGDQNEKQ